MMVSLLQALARMKSSAWEEEQGSVRTGKSCHSWDLVEALSGLWVMQELPHVQLWGSQYTPGQWDDNQEAGPRHWECLDMLGRSQREQ